MHYCQKYVDFMNLAVFPPIAVCGMCHEHERLSRRNDGECVVH